MPILISELTSYQSVNMPEGDTTTSGGAINANGLVSFTDPPVNDTVRVVSTNAGDNQTVTITGRSPAGSIVSENLVLNGVTPVAGAQSFERILKITLSAAAAGSVTVERGTNPYDDIVVIPAGKTSVRRMFYDSASEASAVQRYEKLFLKNENASLTLNAAKVKLSADPSSTVKIALAAAKDDSGSVTNRKTSPGLTFVDDGVSVSVPGNSLEAGSAIGVWVEMSLAVGNAPVDSTFSVELSGTTV